MHLSLLHDKRVAIIGAGPVGLTLANLLQQRGATVTVYERSSGADLRISGGTLDIRAESGQQALAAAGLLPRFQQLARPTAERTADQHGAVLSEEQPDEAAPYDRPEIDRNDLQQLLLTNLASGTVVWSHSFQWLEAHDGRFTLHFANQPGQVADVVVGANGGRSKVRPYVTDAVPEYTGSFIVQGLIPEPARRCPALHALVNGGNLMVRAEQKMFLVHTKADGALNYYVSFREPADWLARRGLSPQPPAPVAQLLTQELATWGSAYHQGIQATQEFTFLPLFRLPLMPARLVTQPITLVGDAAHVMPPFAGIGVNIGLLDALTLADCLTSESYATLTIAIEAYEQAMYGYAHPAQELTATAELLAHSDVSHEQMMEIFSRMDQPDLPMSGQ